jgi:hypothetical protein
MTSKIFLFVFTFWFLSHATTAQFIGLGSRYGHPLCCFASRSVISSAMLSCTPMEMSQPHVHGQSLTPIDCFANDDAFLTTLAYCISQRCNDDKLPTWEREKYWASSATGSPAVPAKWDYSTAFQHIVIPPNFTLVVGNVLNQTSLVSQSSYAVQYRAAQVLDSISARGNKYIYATLTMLKK